MNWLKKHIIIIGICVLYIIPISATDAINNTPIIEDENVVKLTIEGVVFEEQPELTLNQVVIRAFHENRLIDRFVTDKNGAFTLNLPINKSYRVLIEKSGFYLGAEEISTFEKQGRQTLFTSINLSRKPGYTFEASISEILDYSESNIPIKKGLTNVRIEVYNHTNQTQELDHVSSATDSAFHFHFAPGNRYTIMLRKKGYFAKRIEVMIDVEDCIVCLDGVGDLNPNIIDNLSADNVIGVLNTGIDMKKIKVNETIRIENVFYDYDESFIRPDAAIELDKLVILLNDNPDILVELGSHTDARGSDNYNLNLSDERAAAAVRYLVQNSVKTDRITSQGYGETKIQNHCINKVECNEDLHQDNRRTEIKVLGVKTDPTEQMSLKEIIDAGGDYKKDNIN